MRTGTHNPGSDGRTAARPKWGHNSLAQEVFCKGGSMTRDRTHKMNGVARPIKTKKDYSAAASVIEKIGDKPDPETIAEKRLQSLLKAMEKFDEETDEPDGENSDPDYAGPLRRWSDEPGESE
jgi:hypothetical protein